MLQKKNNRILFYFILFFLFGTVNNFTINNFKFPKIDKINIEGLDETENEKLIKDLNYLKLKNLFFIKKKPIDKIIKSHDFIDTYSIFKEYPSSINIRIKKTKFFAKTEKDGIFYLVGSNGKLIKSKFKTSNLPNINWGFNSKEFLKFKDLIDKSDFDYKNIKNIYYFNSKRFDIETNKGTLIKLPNKNIKEALEVYERLLYEQKIEDIKIIDLRIDSQVIING